MSSKASGRVWDLDLPHNKRLVLLAMADHADHDGRNIYPSTDLIAWKTGYSFRQVQRIIDELIADGILSVVKKAKQQHPATYALNFAAGTTKPPFDRTARKQSRQNVTPQGSQNVISESRQNGTPEKSRDDISTHPGMTFDAPRDDIAMSPKPWNLIEPPPPAKKISEQPTGGGGGPKKKEPPTDTQRALVRFGFSAKAAHEFRDLPLDAVECELKAARQSGAGPGALIERWRIDRPDAPKARAPTPIPEPTRPPSIPNALPPHEAVAAILRQKAELDKKKREAAQAA